MKYKNQLEKKHTKDFKMTCPECRAQFVDLFKFNKHIGNLRKKMCGQCYEIVEVTKFQSHAKSHNLNVFSCNLCFESFEKETAFVAHKFEHENGVVACVECQKPFKNPTYLNTHMNKHKSVTCGCGQQLPNRACFFNHKKKCNQYKNVKSKYICDYCNKEYHRKNSLRVHILTHILGRLFQCEECGKKFLSLAHLIEHGNTHLKVMDRFVCFCGAKYSTRRGYQRHCLKHKSNNDFRNKNRKTS